MCHLSSVFSFASSTDFRDNHWVQFKRWITDTFFTSRSRRPMFIIISKPNPFNLRLTVSDSAINKQTNKQRKTVSKLKKKIMLNNCFDSNVKILFLSTLDLLIFNTAFAHCVYHRLMMFVFVWIDIYTLFSESEFSITTLLNLTKHIIFSLWMENAECKLKSAKQKPHLSRSQYTYLEKQK